MKQGQYTRISPLALQPPEDVFPGEMGREKSGRKASGPIVKIAQKNAGTILVFKI